MRGSRTILADGTPVLYAPPGGRKLTTFGGGDQVALALALLVAFCVLAVIGNTIFGAPAEGVTGGWTFGIPSIWAWQILFWILGVGMMWFLAYKMEMSTVPDKEIEALVEDIGDVAPTGAAAGGDD